MKKILFALLLLTISFSAQAQNEMVKFDISKNQTVEDTLVSSGNNTYLVSFAIRSTLVDSAFIEQKYRELDKVETQLDRKREKRNEMRKELKAIERKRKKQ